MLDGVPSLYSSWIIWAHDVLIKFILVHIRDIFTPCCIYLIKRYWSESNKSLVRFFCPKCTWYRPEHISATLQRIIGGAICKFMQMFITTRWYKEHSDVTEKQAENFVEQHNFSYINGFLNRAKVHFLHSKEGNLGAGFPDQLIGIRIPVRCRERLLYWLVRLVLSYLLIEKIGLFLWKWEELQQF